MLPAESQKQKAADWFYALQRDICQAFEALEGSLTGSDKPAGKFEFKPWDRNGGGEGTMAVMRGRVFEKVGVNVSVVHGAFSEEFRGAIPGTDQHPQFWAAGISIVAHMCSPLVPAVHMNTRHVITGKSWFGGGTDLTPYYPFEEDVTDFHQSLQHACDTYDPTYYPKFKQWCDAYFYLPHRKEPRGVGGIFYDYVNTGNWDQDFAFTQAVGRTFLDIYPKIVGRRMQLPWTPEQREHQLMRRGRYVEFNLLYDRGTAFGLKTDGNVEAILMSLPPEVKWG